VTKQSGSRLSGDHGAFETAYPNTAARVKHTFCDHPLFERPALEKLSGRLDAAKVEYNRGDLPIHQAAGAAPGNGLSIEETIRSIEENGSWLVLKNVEVDPAYEALLDEYLAELEPVVAPKTGPYLMREAFIFISSPHSVTPFHIDPEHNILNQIAGEKHVRVFERRPDILPPEAEEAFHSLGGHRNLEYRDAFEAYADDYHLSPGDGVHIPVKAPHWVRNGSAVSISFSVTWRSRMSDNDQSLHIVNSRIRRLGFNPSPRGSSGTLDTVKVLAHRFARRAVSVVRRDQQ